MLPVGVVARDLTPYHDHRGTFVELHRVAWGGPRLLQWNAVRSAAKVLRGVHVHATHDDYLTVPVGRATVGLRDLRRGSPTEGLVAMIRLGEDLPVGLTIPHGVAHGFLFEEQSVHVYAVSEYFDMADEFGCRFDDPELGIDWPTADVILSPKDESAGSFAALMIEVGDRLAYSVEEPVLSGG